MKNYLISYDLHKSGQNYDGLIDVIKSYPNARRLLASVWFIHSSKSSVAIRDHLLNQMDENDNLIVVEIANGNSAWCLSEQASNFLKSAL